jgi:hypothetical protein
MHVSNCRFIVYGFQSVLLAAGLLLASASIAGAQEQSIPRSAVGAASSNCDVSVSGSRFIPVDSWIYPAALRLYSLGYIDSAYLDLRPWTRKSLVHMLDETSDHFANPETGKAQAGFEEAQDIYMALTKEMSHDAEGACLKFDGQAQVESLYSLTRGMSGTPLRDSYHIGSTIVNDYGRPYANGVNNYSGASGYASMGRFLLYARGEFQGSPSAAGYSTALAQSLSSLDNVVFINPATGKPFNQATIPLGPISSVTDGRFMEAYLATNLLGHEISFGKQDQWLGPGQGGAMAYSNNAENIYAFHINRIEPLMVPGLSRVTGPFRYEFLVGSLKGHTSPNDPWVHVEKVSLKPTRNMEFGFERTVIWGGKNHEAINLHTFLRSFFSTVNVSGATKFSPADPGARFAAFDFTYRLPFVRNWLTLYADSEVHDDVSPADAPRRASWRPGLYLSHVPNLPKLDVRVEGMTTDPPVDRSIGGSFMYYEAVQVQGYTNKGELFGDWVGREDKGGQAWTTYHLSANEWLQAGFRHQKAAKDFIAGGTTLNDFSFEAVKRFNKSLEVRGNFAFEHWKAPIYLSGQQTVTTTSVELTWFPSRKTSF